MEGVDPTTQLCTTKQIHRYLVDHRSSRQPASHARPAPSPRIHQHTATPSNHSAVSFLRDGQPARRPAVQEPRTRRRRRSGVGREPVLLLGRHAERFHRSGWVHQSMQERIDVRPGVLVLRAHHREPILDGRRSVSPPSIDRFG